MTTLSKIDSAKAMGSLMLDQAKGAVGKFISSEKGVTAVEYAVVVAGVAAVVMVIFNSKTGPVAKMLDSTFTSLENSVTNTINNGGQK